jgi:hypothetical protein
MLTCSWYRPRSVNWLNDAGHGDVEIIPVATLEEALQALEDLGGDPLVPVDVALS